MFSWKTLQSLGVIVIFLVLVFPSSGEAANIVLNPGFETGDLTNWTLGGTATYTYVLSMPYSGDYALASGDYPEFTSVSQLMSTAAGQTYNISFWLRNFSGYGDYYEAYWGGTSLEKLEGVDQFDYEQRQFTMTASGTSTLLEFRFVNQWGYWNLDDVDVSEAGTGPAVPEPGTFVLALSGLAALVLLRNRLRG